MSVEDESEYENVSEHDAQFADLRKLNRLDKFRLDAEWLRQPGAYQYWGEQEAKAENLYNEAEDELKIRSAEIENEFRLSPPEKYKGVKITNDLVNSYLLAHDELKAITKKLRARKLDWDMCRVARRSMDHRKDSLDGLTRLHARGYWQDPHFTARGEAMHDEMLDNLNKNH